MEDSKNAIGYNSQIKHYKSNVTLIYATHERVITTWKKGTTYKQGDIVYQDLGAVNDSNRGWLDDWFKRVGLWSVCMEEHVADEKNMPYDDEIFNDLVIDIVPHIQLLLIEHVKGFNTYLASLITSLAYKTNKFWWNGCVGNRLTSRSVSWESCGNLITSLDGKHCKKCKFNNNKDLIDGITYNASNKHGSSIRLNKDTGKLERIIVNENETDEKSENNIISKFKTLIFLNSNVCDKLKKKKIYNLLNRNFNKSMSSLIKCCINGNTTWSYGTGMFIKSKVKLGNVKLWALYGDYNQNELLCALLWRSVLGKDASKRRNILMFEVLFLSTSEHVRYQHFGMEMVKRINAFAMSNCYDIISVAAVPRHGVSFWSKNGFVENGIDSHPSDWRHVGEKKAYVEFMKKNMLVFIDTPLFARFLT